MTDLQYYNDLLTVFFIAYWEGFVFIPMAFVFAFNAFIIHTNSMLFIPKNKTKQAFKIKKNSEGYFNLYIKRVVLFIPFYSAYYDNEDEDCGGEIFHLKETFYTEESAKSVADQISELAIKGYKETNITYNS
jgi:hypothetical protein